ncbi:RNA ligase RtcB family protein [Gallaecimonas pentaromativorans]|uniref:RNA ligase RtcB family protein n=1 Tax=Gallaecimonas pentaromativorans TaxID=584787 RepID=UPI003A956E4A
MGNSVQTLSDKVSLIASPRTWVEGLAIEQLQKTAELPGMVRVVGMPDLHPGRGYPVGAAFLSLERFYPALVGNDIGCGMALWQCDLPLAKAKPDKLARRLGAVEGPLDESWHSLVAERKAALGISEHGYDGALGTIGGGNHFAEFQAVERLYQKDLLDPKQLLLLVHSGSRGLGQAVLQQHLAAFGHQGLIANTEEASLYLARHNQALRWAELNRELIARRFIDAIGSSGHCLLDVNHNLVSETSDGWLHRKGATPSTQGLVVIPGSRGDHSYLVRPTQSELGLHSLAHGAGRKWQRGDCKSRLSHKYRREDLLRTAFGSQVICNDKTLLFDEAPQAYKPCHTVIEALLDAGLVELVARLKPVLTFKTQGECC